MTETIEKIVAEIRSNSSFLLTSHEGLTAMPSVLSWPWPLFSA